jgi:hypothetical protein
MKLILFISLLFSFSVMAKNAPAKNCYKMTDNLDREYCQKKKRRALEKNFKNNHKQWSKKGLTKKQKNNKLKQMNKRLAARKALLADLEHEIKVINNYKKKLKKLKPKTAAAAPVKKMSRRDKLKAKLKKLFK